MEANNDTRPVGENLIVKCRISFGFRNRNMTGIVRALFRSCRKQPDGAYKEFDSLMVEEDDCSAVYCITPNAVMQILDDPRWENDSKINNNLKNENDDEILETNKNGASH